MRLTDLGSWIGGPWLGESNVRNDLEVTVDQFLLVALFMVEWTLEGQNIGVCVSRIINQVEVSGHRP